MTTTLEKPELTRKRARDRVPVAGGAHAVRRRRGRQGSRRDGGRAQRRAHRALVLGQDRPRPGRHASPRRQGRVRLVPQQLGRLHRIRREIRRDQRRPGDHRDAGRVQGRRPGGGSNQQGQAGRPVRGEHLLRSAERTADGIRARENVGQRQRPADRGPLRDRAGMAAARRRDLPVWGGPPHVDGVQPTTRAEDQHQGRGAEQSARVGPADLGATRQLRRDGPIRSAQADPHRRVLLGARRRRRAARPRAVTCRASSPIGSAIPAGPGRRNGTTVRGSTGPGDRSSTRFTAAFAADRRFSSSATCRPATCSCTPRSSDSTRSAASRR